MLVMKERINWLIVGLSQFKKPLHNLLHDRILSLLLYEIRRCAGAQVSFSTQTSAAHYSCAEASLRYAYD